MKSGNQAGIGGMTMYTAEARISSTLASPSVCPRLADAANFNHDGHDSRIVVALSGHNQNTYIGKWGISPT